MSIDGFSPEHDSAMARARVPALSLLSGCPRQVFEMPIFAQQRMPAGLGYRAPLGSGDTGTQQTIEVMRQLVDQDLANSSFVRFAKDLVRHVAPHDEWSEVQAVYDWVHSNVRFVKDPLTKEALYPPSQLLQIRSGDCDDISMLLGALYLAIGYPARLVTVAANEQSPDEFSHVYAEVEVPPGSGSWIAADAARPGAQFGVHPPMYSRRRAWSLVDDSYQDLSGMSRVPGLGYLRYRTLGGLGQDDGSIDWSSIISQGLTETPQMMAIASGQGTRSSTLATSPYASFSTMYTPGATIPQAGYGYTGLPSAFSSTTSDWIWPLIGVAVVLMLMKK